MRRSIKVILFVLLGIAAVFTAVVGGLNIAKFAIFGEYYRIKDNVCTLPGISDGFVCQALCYDEENEKIYVTGYMKDKSASRVYVTDEDNNSYYVSLASGGGVMNGHCGGMGIAGGRVYIATNYRIYTVMADELAGAQNGSVIDIGEGTLTHNKASFAYADGEFIYLGEYHDGGAYLTEHPYDTPHGTQHAVISRFRRDDLSGPDRVYSIRDRVQGMSVTEDGMMVLVTSYGISDSHYYFYSEEDIYDSGHTLEGAPVYYLGECVRDIKAPAMAEGLDIYGGRLITMFESASDKYIFGKFFFADKIVALNV